MSAIWKKILWDLFWLGSEYMTKAMSLIMTCKLQTKNYFNFLKEFLRCFFANACSLRLLHVRGQLCAGQFFKSQSLLVLKKPNWKKLFLGLFWFLNFLRGIGLIEAFHSPIRWVQTNPKASKTRSFSMRWGLIIRVSSKRQPFVFNAANSVSISHRRK